MSPARRNGGGRGAAPRGPRTKGASGRSRSGKARPQRGRRWRWLRNVALGSLAVGFVAGLLASRWVVALDRIVVERFEGRRFSVPSRVLSAPTILYPGLDWERADLRGTLVRLGYRDGAARRTLPPGYYRWGPGHLRVHLRSFDHPSRPEPERDIRLDLEGSRIEAIRELPRGREVGAVMLEPEQVGAYYGHDREQRELVRVEDLPHHVVDAILAVEDQRFEEHHGIDPRSIARAVFTNLRAGGIREGASTLTQQLVKNFFLTPERTLGRKAQEAVMALLVEARYEKPAILEAYLNEIYLGQRGSTAVHGVGEAAHFYFGKPASDLTLAESALLAAIIQSPNGISPFRHPERAVERRDLVLALMHSQGRIDDAELERARSEPLQLAAVTPDPGEARYFLDALRRQLPEVYDTDVLSAEGLHIYSTLDLRLQRIAARVLVEGLERLEEEHPSLRRDDPTERLQGCLVALRPQTGEIVALVGGRDYARSQFDRCTQARRPPGSAFKPFVYAAALEPGRGGQPVITLADFLDDTPLEVPTAAGLWAPENIDHAFHGRVPVREALERSLNVPAARLGQRVGIDRVAAMARRLGVTSPLPRVPSLALGTGEVAPIEMARAYATLANGGVRTWPHAFEDVVDAQGRTLERRKLSLEEVLDPATAYLTTSLLEGVVDRGTGAGLRRHGLQGPIAGKTGTSDDEHDLWFAGFTPELVVVVWVGFDEPQSLGLSSTHVALPIWGRFVKEAEGTTIRGHFLPPSGIERAWIDPETGALALDGCPERREEVFATGTVPDEVCGSPGRWVGGRERRNLFEWLRDVL